MLFNPFSESSFENSIRYDITTKLNFAFSQFTYQKTKYTNKHDIL